MLDAGAGAGQLEGMGAEQLSGLERRPDLGDGRAARARVGEVRPVIREHGVDPVGHHRDQAAEEVGRDAPGRPLVQLREGELAGAVDGDEQVELALLGAQLGDVDVEEADRVGLERLSRLRSLDVRQPADAVALEAPMQR